MTESAGAVVPGKLFIVSGPSGVGKSTVIGKFFQLYPNHYFSVSVTTRHPRPGEQDGVDYHYINNREFQRMIDADELLEYAVYVSSSYGTPRLPVEENMAAGRDVFLDIETVGCGKVKAKRPDAVSIFILPPSLEELRRRLTSRGTESAEKVASRLKRAEEEIALADRYDYQIVNDDVEAAAKELLDIVLKEKSQ